MSHDRLAVYVPDPDAPPRVALHVKHIDPRSGIVGMRVVPDDPESPIVVYYEGNRFGAANIVTFADRCHHAAGRLRENYPTTATAVVRPEAVKQAGWFYFGHGVEVENAEQLVAIAKWLDMWDEKAGAVSELHDELRLNGGRR